VVATKSASPLHCSSAPTRRRTAPLQ